MSEKSETVEDQLPKIVPQEEPKLLVEMVTKPLLEVPVPKEKPQAAPEAEAEDKGNFNISFGKKEGDTGRSR